MEAAMAAAMVAVEPDAFAIADSWFEILRSIAAHNAKSPIFRLGFLS
jgi:hypothetical protein